MATYPTTRHRSADTTGHRSSDTHRSWSVDGPPEVLLALATVLVVVAGPVAHALSFSGPVLSGLSLVLLLVGAALALTAAVRLIRS